MPALPIRHLERLDTLRAIAVIIVVLFHLRPDVIPWGYIGVDMFFSLSGFLMTWLYLLARAEGESFSASRFIARRFWRIFPPLVITILCSLCIALFFFSPGHLENAAKSGLAALASVSNWWFYSEAGYFDTAAINKPLLHTWSLGVEEQFYGFFAVALLAVRYVPLWTCLACAAALSLLFWTWVVLANNGFALPVLHEEPYSALFFLPQYRGYQFALGGIAAYFCFNSGARMSTYRLGLLGLCILVFGFWVAADKSFAHLSALVVTVAMFLTMSSTTLLDQMARWRLVRYFARISYQLYLVHWPIVVFWTYATGESLNWSSVLLCGALCIILGEALFRVTNTLRAK